MRLIHWGRVTHICIGNITIIGPDNGLSFGRRQAIIWTNAGILLIWTVGTNFSEILIEILTFSLKNAFESVVCEMAAMLFRSKCVNITANKNTSHLTVIKPHYVYISSSVGLQNAWRNIHYTDVIMVAIASQITSLTIVYSTVNSDADQRKHQSSASLAFVWGIHRPSVCVASQLQTR